MEYTVSWVYKATRYKASEAIRPIFEAKANVSLFLHRSTSMVYKAVRS